MSFGKSEKVNREENMLLEVDLTEAETFQAIKDSCAEGALNPDGFSFLFYQKF
jgi:hypothetical protein